MSKKTMKPSFFVFATWRNSTVINDTYKKVNVVMHNKVLALDLGAGEIVVFTDLDEKELKKSKSIGV